MTMTIREADEKIAAALRAAGHLGLAGGFGPYEAKREADALALRQQAIEALASDVRELRRFVRAVWEQVHGDWRQPRTITHVADVIEEAIDEDALFEECDECGGLGEVVDEIPDEFGVQRHRGGCTGCVNGRTPR